MASVSDDVTFTESEPQVRVPKNYKYRPHSDAVISGSCTQLLHTRKNCTQMYTNYMKSPSGDYCDQVNDENSRIDLTLAFVSSRSFYLNFSAIPQDMLLVPKVCQSIVQFKQTAYIDLDPTMRCHPDVIMTLMEAALGNDGISDFVLNMVPRACGAVKEIITGIVDIAFQYKPLCMPHFTRIWTHFYSSAMTSRGARVLLHELHWFEPLVYKALSIIGQSEWEGFECTVNLFSDTNDMGLSFEESEKFKRVRYTVLLNGISNHNINRFGRILNLCKDDVGFICYVARMFPHKFAKCANFIASDYETFCKLINGLSEQDSDVDDVKRIIAPSFHMKNRRDCKLGDFVDVVVELYHSQSSAEYFTMWADNHNWANFLDLFASKSPFMGDFRASFKGRTNAAYFDEFNFTMLPTIWIQNKEFVKRLLHDVDMQILEKLLNDFKIREFHNEVFINEDKYLEIRQLKKIIDMPTVLPSILYEATPDFFKVSDESPLKVALEVAFADPELPYLSSLHRLLFARPVECATVFALSMIRFSDDIEACKSIIKKNDLEISGCLLVALLPRKVQQAIISDRKFLVDIFKGFSGLGIRLPDEIRYDDEFVRMTIAYHPVFMQGYEAERISKNYKMVDLALSTERAACWMFKNLPETERESANLVKKTMRDERLSVQTRRHIFRDLPAIVKTQRWCKKLSTELFGTVMYATDDDEIDDPVMVQILRIAHDNHSSKDGKRSYNTAFLRSLFIDIQQLFLPKVMKEALKLNPKTAESLKTYAETDLQRFADDANRLENLKHSELVKRYEYLNELTDAVSSIVTPRRRDGSYPSNHYSENFEGVSVKFTKSLDGTSELTTMSGKPVYVPPFWQSEFDNYPKHLNGFWGKLHAGFGQQQKATMLKNGTIGKYTESDTASKKAAARACWEGVSIKVYGTYDSNDQTCGIFPNTLCSSDNLSFVDVVRTHVISSEVDVVEMHRESINRGGLGVVFRDQSLPLKLIALDSGGYAKNVQQIVDFLTKYPLAVLSAYVHEFEDDEVEKEDSETDKSDFAKIVKEMTNSMITVKSVKAKRKAPPTTTTLPAAKKQAVVAKKLTPKAPTPAKRAPAPDSDSDDDDDYDDVDSDSSDDDGIPYVSSEDDGKDDDSSDDSD